MPKYIIGKQPSNAVFNYNSESKILSYTKRGELKNNIIYTGVLENKLFSSTSELSIDLEPKYRYIIECIGNNDVIFNNNIKSSIECEIILIFAPNYGGSIIFPEDISFMEYSQFEFNTEKNYSINIKNNIATVNEYNSTWYTKPLTFTSLEDNSSISMGNLKSGLKYRTNIYDEFKSYTKGDVIYLNKDEYVQFYSNNTSRVSYSYPAGSRIIMTGKISASGNIQSLVNYSDSVPTDCYSHLFYDCTSLVTPPNLPATNLSIGCYSKMFNGCINLQYIPDLPATVLYDQSYSAMFEYCKSITRVPDMSHIKTSSGYSMTSMFNYCTSLEVAEGVPSVGDISWMFDGCSKLKSIKCYFKSWSSRTLMWVSGVSTTGTFYKPSALPEKYGEDYIPKGWTVVNI